MSARVWRVLLVVAVSCRTLPGTPDPVLKSLASSPGFVQGTPVALGPRTVVHAEDFVYDARLSPDGQSLAFVHLGLKGYVLSAAANGTAKPKPFIDAFINSYELDVEAVEYSADGSLIVTAGRDGSVRLFDAKTGAARAAWLTDEPLVSLCVHRDFAAVGSAKGLVTILSLPGLEYFGEARGHSGEVRGLACASDGRVFSGGWDKRVIAWLASVSVHVTSSGARTHIEKRQGSLVFRSILNGRASASTSIDERLQHTVISSALAQSAGIDVLGLTSTTELSTAFGKQLVKTAQGQVSVKRLAFERVTLAICDSCLPQGVQAVLGASLLERLDTVTDAATEELIITAKANQAAYASVNELNAVKTFRFDAFINDLTLDAAARTLGLALSNVKAERTREIYEREKRKEPAPLSANDCSARVDAVTGEVFEKFCTPHSGVVATAAISPDGQSLVTGDWSNHVSLFTHGQSTFITSEKLGGPIRRVRYFRDGTRVSVAAWTPQNPVGDHQSDPSALVYGVQYGPDAKAVTTTSP